MDIKLLNLYFYFALYFLSFLIVCKENKKTLENYYTNKDSASFGKFLNSSMVYSLL